MEKRIEKLYNQMTQIVGFEPYRIVMDSDTYTKWSIEQFKKLKSPGRWRGRPVVVGKISGIAVEYDSVN